MLRRPLLLVVPVLVCLAAAVTTIAGRGGDPALALRERQLARLTPPAVESLVSTAPDPRGADRPKGRASCRPGTSAGLRNPWRCSIVYRGAFVTRYLVTIKPDGSYTGRRLDEPGSI